ncbi:MAG: AsnC family transcriptional regulator [Candidatus Bathyarchaeia archaeon]
MDEVDRKIISHLQLDGRATFKDLAEIVGFSNMGAKKRVARLIQKGVMKVSALVNAEKLGLHAALVLI